MEVESYVELYKEVKAKVGSDEIAAVILDQVGKDGRVRAMNEGGNARQPGSGGRLRRSSLEC